MLEVVLRLPSLTGTLRTRLTGGLANDWQTYHEIVADRLRPGMQVLEVGCGRGDVAPFPWAKFPQVELTGLDIDPSAAANPFLTRLVIASGQGPWALDDASFDLVICRYVLEHVEDPSSFLRNVRRVLKPGAPFIALTPNAWHPQIVVGRLLPLACRRLILKATKGVGADDVFRTFYRLNSPPRLARLASEHGFRFGSLLTKEFVPSDYLGFFVPGFLLSWVYFAAVTTTGWDRYFGAQMVAVLQASGPPSLDAP